MRDQVIIQKVAKKGGVIETLTERKKASTLKTRLTGKHHGFERPISDSPRETLITEEIGKATRKRGFFWPDGGEGRGRQKESYRGSCSI